MITLSYELLGVMMIAPMIVIFIMYEILLNKKRKEIERARKANREDFLGLLGDKDKQIKDLEEEYSTLFENWEEDVNEGYNKQAIIESKDEKLRSLGEMIDEKEETIELKQKQLNNYRKIYIRDNKEMQTKKPKTQYRKIEALRNRFKAIKKGEVYSGKEVIEDGIKMYSVKVNGATYILKRSNFKIIK